MTTTDDRAWVYERTISSPCELSAQVRLNTCMKVGPKQTAYVNLIKLSVFSGGLRGTRTKLFQFHGVF